MNNRPLSLCIFTTVKRLISSLRRMAVSLIVLCTLPASAQELEYAMEVGGMAGGSFYLGDANYSGFYKNLCPSGGQIGNPPDLLALLHDSK